MARSVGFSVRSLELPDVSQLDGAFAAAVQDQARAVIVLSDGSFYSRRAQIAQLAAKRRLVCVAWTPEFALSGCLMTYGANVVDLHRRAALFRGQDSERRESGGLARRAAHQVRARHQPQDREGARADDPSVSAAAGGSSDSVAHAGLVTSRSPNGRPA